MKPQICSQCSSPGCCCSQQKPQPIILPRLESTEGVCKMGAKFLTAKHKIYIRNTLVRGEDSHSPGVLPEYICPVSSPVLLLTLYILFLLAFTDSSGKVRWVWVPPLSWHIAKCVCFGVLLPFWLLLYLFIFFSRNCNTHLCKGHQWWFDETVCFPFWCVRWTFPCSLSMW